MHHSKAPLVKQAPLVPIQADRFQPFSSRMGVDTVVRLQFEYCPALVARLKALLEVYRVDHRYRVVGGWLPEQKCWFVEPDAWAVIKLELLYLGYHIVSEE